MVRQDVFQAAIKLTLNCRKTGKKARLKMKSPKSWIGYQLTQVMPSSLLKPVHMGLSLGKETAHGELSFTSTLLMLLPGARVTTMPTITGISPTDNETC